MKEIYLHMAGALALTFGIAACVPQAQPPAPTPPPPVASPAPAPAPSPTPTPPPAPPPVVQEPQYDNYLDAPQSSGTWDYAMDGDSSMAWFGSGPNELASDLMIVCIYQTREIWIGRRGTTRAGTMEIQTETTQRLLSVAPEPGEGNIVVAKLDPRDPILDAMAITKGRVAVGLEGSRTLYVPAWVEISRVIEDCR